jgi:hypothetical protein
MQDSIADKLLPTFLQTAGEQTGTVIENLNRAEKLSLIINTQQWLIAIQTYTHNRLNIK